MVFVFSFFVLYLPQEIVYFLAKKRKNWDDEYDMMGYNLGKYTGNNFAYKKCRDLKTKVREKKVVILSGFFRSSG